MPAIQTAVNITHKYTECSYGGNRSVNVVIQAEDIPPGVTWRDLTVIKPNNKWLEGLFLLLKSRKDGKVMDTLCCATEICLLLSASAHSGHMCSANTTAPLRTTPHCLLSGSKPPKPAFPGKQGCSSDAASQSVGTLTHNLTSTHSPPDTSGLRSDVVPAYWPWVSPPIYH